MTIARIYNNGRLAIKGEIIEDGGTRFTEEGNIYINELIEVENTGIRYIRDWISGSSVNNYNHWSEIKAIANGINVALGKEVTTNFPYNVNSLPWVTNGSLEGYADLGADPKTYVQIDLGSIYDVSEIKVWHYFLDGRMYYDTKTEVSADGVNWVPIYDSTGVEEMYYHETVEGKTHLVPPIYIGNVHYKIKNSNMYVNELIEDKDRPVIPEGYVLATDDDFSGTTNGSFRYIGSDLKIIIPDIIKGVAVTRYTDMFKESNVIGVVSYNKNVTDMAGMFNGSKATILDLSNFDTSNVTDMSRMFYNSKATSLDLSNFDTSSVINMRNMFNGSQATSLDLSNFDTSNVTNMSDMFSQSKATSFDLNSFDTSKVTDMRYMFSQSKATSLDLSNFDTSNVTNMTGMFFNSPATSLDLSNFDTSNVTNMSIMFNSSRATLLDLSSFDTSSVNETGNMFQYSQTTTGYARTQADADKFNASSNKPTGLNFIVKP